MQREKERKKCKQRIKKKKCILKRTCAFWRAKKKFVRTINLLQISRYACTKPIHLSMCKCMASIVPHYTYYMSFVQTRHDNDRLHFISITQPDLLLQREQKNKIWVGKFRAFLFPFLYTCNKLHHISQYSYLSNKICNMHHCLAACNNKTYKQWCSLLMYLH